MKLSEHKASSTQTVLVYGPPKSGKTQLVGDLAHTHKLIWFDLEAGSETLFKLPPEAQERVELIKLPDSRMFPIAIETCLKVIRGTTCHIDNTTGKVLRAPTDNTITITLNDLDSSYIVVFDSLTQLTNSAIANITKGQPDDYKLDYNDWGNLGKLMDIFLSQIQTAPFNVVCISHETEATLEEGKTRIVPVAGTRNFSRNSAKYFGHVIYCQVDFKKHKFSSMTTDLVDIVVGSRTDVSLKGMSTPSLAPIFELPTSAVQTQAQTALSKLKGLKK